jgi:hypothetical protein
VDQLDSFENVLLETLLCSVEETMPDETVLELSIPILKLGDQQIDLPWDRSPINVIATAAKHAAMDLGDCRLVYAAGRTVALCYKGYSADRSLASSVFTYYLYRGLLTWFGDSKCVVTGVCECDRRVSDYLHELAHEWQIMATHKYLQDIKCEAASIEDALQFAMILPISYRINPAQRYGTYHIKTQRGWETRTGGDPVELWEEATAW